MERIKVIIPSDFEHVLGTSWEFVNKDDRVIENKVIKCETIKPNQYFVHRMIVTGMAAPEPLASAIKKFLPGVSQITCDEQTVIDLSRRKSKSITKYIELSSYCLIQRVDRIRANPENPHETIVEVEFERGESSIPSFFINLILDFFSTIVNGNFAKMKVDTNAKPIPCDPQ